MPLIETKGAASAQGFGEFAKTGEAVYIESCFSTWLYTGNGSTQTITNGIDLSTKGGLVWIKSRISSVYDHQLVDTTRGSTKYISSNLTNTESTSTNRVTAFDANGFTLAGGSQVNESTGSFASWTFRKQPKFFDVVTYTGNGGSPSPLTVSHSLGSVPGCVMIKKTNGTADWVVFHRGLTGGLGSSKFIRLNTTAAEANAAGGIAATSTAIDIYGYTGSTDNTNDSGGTYVMYLFAHNAGGFGLTGTDNVISCGSFTTDGSGEATVTLGYEPQWALIKPSNSTGDWVLVDTMRSWVVAGNNDALLYPNSSGAEVTGNNFGNPTATGFQVGGLTFSNTTYIYIAIRRGPMKTPTTGTSVFVPSQWPGTFGSGNQFTGFPVDSLWSNYLLGDAWNTQVYDRLRRASSTNSSLSGGLLSTSQTSAESSTNGSTQGWFNDRFNQAGGSSNIYYAFRRAPGFFDVVCYTGTGANLTLNHNLGVAPELIITKRRNGATYGAVYASSLGVDKYLELFSSSSGGRSAAQTFSGSWLTPTSTTFGVGVTDQNLSAATYVAYLFSTVAGVSKVGSYTGNGSSQTINCGFTGGARFVLIKRTNAAGDWVVFDSARGIVSGNDPFLELNTTAAEQTGQDAVDTDSTGFVVNETTENLNVNGASYIFLAIA
jgi:hypothetical protein